MRIAFLTPEFPHHATGPSGGLGTSIKNLATSLIAQGVDVFVVVYGQEKSSSFTENGINFHLVRQIKYPLLGWYLYRKFLQNFLNTLILKEKIDLVEAPDWTGITAFIRLKCKLIIRLHGTDAYFCHLEGRKQKLKNRFFENRALRLADDLVSVSSFTAAKTNEIFNLNKRIPVIANGIDTMVFKSVDTPFIENRLLYFGSVIRKKGVLALAKIFNEIIQRKPETELFIIGKDVIDVFTGRSTLEMFETILSPFAQKRCTYIPEVTYEEIRDYLSKANVVILPSFAEAFPMTWLEAMAMEKALVTSNIGWAKEIVVHGETGFMEDPNNHIEYANHVLHLINDQDLAHQIGKNAGKSIREKFSSILIAEKNISFYSSRI